MLGAGIVIAWLQRQWSTSAWFCLFVLPGGGKFTIACSEAGTPFAYIIRGKFVDSLKEWKKKRLYARAPSCTRLVAKKAWKRKVTFCWPHDNVYPVPRTAMAISSKGRILNEREKDGKSIQHKRYAVSSVTPNTPLKQPMISFWEIPVWIDWMLCEQWKWHVKCSASA